jgi:hypothetical protein
VTKKYQNNEFDTSALAVPEQVSIAMEEIAADMREGFLALAVGAELQVMQQLVEADAAAACGPKGKHNTERAATRHSTEHGRPDSSTASPASTYLRETMPSQATSSDTPNSCAYTITAPAHPERA